MTQSGTEFDPVFSVEGVGELMSATESGRGVLLVATHAALNLLVLRYLHDIGQVPMVIVADTNMLILGTRQRSDNFAPVGGYMLRARARWRSGGMVCTMIDRADSGRRMTEVAASGGPVIISNAMFRVAERAKAEVVFTHIGLQKSKLCMVFRRTVPCSELGPPNQMMRQFIDFIEERWLLTKPASPEILR